MRLSVKNQRQGKKNLNNYGFSLIELLISIAILAIVIAPLLNNFVIAAKVSAKARKIQNETLLAQNIMEDIKSKSIEDIAEEYNYPDPGIIKSELKWINGMDSSGGYEVVNAGERSSQPILDALGVNTGQYILENKQDKPYIFTQQGIEYGNKNYDALITMDSKTYIQTDPSGVKIGYNAFKMPIISEINISKNVLAIQSYEDELAIASLYSKHVAYCAEQVAFHVADPSYHITQQTAVEVKASLQKKIIINITKNLNETQLEVIFEYTSSYDGCGTESYTIINKKVIAPMESIYIFYNQTFKDSVLINKDSLVTESIDVYLVKQEFVLGETIVQGLNHEEVLTPIPSGINIFSNVNYLGVSELVKEKVKNRIFNIKVQLYNRGTDYGVDQLCTEFSSTKKE